MQAALGLSMALGGAAALLLLQHAMERLLGVLPEEVLATADLHTPTAILVIGAALSLYFGARSFGHGVLGLFACTAILWFNAADMARRRIRWIRSQTVEASLSRRYQRAALLQMLAAWTSFGGCVVYLLR
ncbi:MAG: hypothetical protein U1E65_22485 [Myxococcota bacterium]